MRSGKDVGRVVLDIGDTISHLAGMENNNRFETAKQLFPFDKNLVIFRNAEPQKKTLVFIVIVQWPCSGRYHHYRYWMIMVAANTTHPTHPISRPQGFHGISIKPGQNATICARFWQRARPSARLRLRKTMAVPRKMMVVQAAKKRAARIYSIVSIHYEFWTIHVWANVQMFSHFPQFPPTPPSSESLKLSLCPVCLTWAKMLLIFSPRLP